MNERMRESLSALMDDEANELELERVLSLLGTDKELRLAWTRYNLAQQSLHDHQPAYCDWDISARVQSALADTPSNLSSGARTLTKNGLLRPLISFGIAASVALTVVVGGRQIAQLSGADPHGGDSAFMASASPVGMLNSLGATTVQASYGMQAIPVLQPATRTAYQELAQQRQRRYMQEHAEQAALNSPQGLVPFARVAEIRE
ncbi:MAG: sigma-E factor negative regulatory protein [Halioglobus sp.]